MRKVFSCVVERRDCFEVKEVEVVAFKPESGIPYDISAWYFEPKIDGQRCYVVKLDKMTEFLTRDLEPFKNFKEKIEILKKGLKLKAGTVLDSELCVRKDECFLWLFDIQWWCGEDVRGLKIEERRELLSRLTFDENFVKIIPVYEVRDMVELKSLFKKVKQEGHEGLVAKKKGSVYDKNFWLKIKNL